MDENWEEQYWKLMVEENFEEAIPLKFENFPKSFYKYRNLSERTIENIEQNYIWLAEISSLNDPFECSIQFDNDECWREYYSSEKFENTFEILTGQVITKKGNILLFAGTGKYITKDASPAIFTQALCYLAMARNAVGSLIPASLIGYVENIRILDFHNKLAGKIDIYESSASFFYTSIYTKAISRGSNTVESSVMAGKALFAKVNQQAVLLAGKEMFGTMAIFGIALISLLLLMHFSGHVTRQIPTWRNIRSILSSRQN